MVGRGKNAKHGAGATGGPGWGGKGMRTLGAAAAPPQVRVSGGVWVSSRITGGLPCGPCRVVSGQPASAGHGVCSLHTPCTRVLGTRRRRCLIGRVMVRGWACARWTPPTRARVVGEEGRSCTDLPGSRSCCKPFFPGRCKWGYTVLSVFDLL